MTDDSLISDDLLRTLVGVGHVDLLVGVPTLNHAASIADVVRAVDASFRKYFPRQRTVLVNADAGSTDNTLTLIRDCGVDPLRTVTASLGLRTTHRISIPYDGLPGKASVVRMMFSAADLLQARTVVMLNPDVGNITPEFVAALGMPVRDQRFDFVAPAYHRQPAEGLLVTQLLRPLVRGAFGWRMSEPLPGEFGCSGRFAAACVEQPMWSSDIVQRAGNLWLTGSALAGAFKAGQVWLGSRRLAPGVPRPPMLRDLFPHVVASAFAMLDAHDEYWLPRTEVEDVPAIGAAKDEGGHEEIEAPDGARILESFSQDVRNLDEILRRILIPDTFAALVAAAEDPAGARLSDELWCSIVADFLVAYHHNVMRRDHIAQALLPLYMARTGTFLLEHASSAPDAVEAALESLCVRFEQAKRPIVDRWTQPAVR